MKVIYKYEIQKLGENKLLIPEDAEVLSFQYQNGIPVIWVLQKKDDEVIERTFTILPTGAEISSCQDYEYIGTIQEMFLVWHLFEMF